MGFPLPDSGEVTEDSGVVGGLISTSGDVDYFLTDDTGQWTAETISGAYGSTLVIDDDGVWTYSATNDHPSIAELDDGETLTEVFTVTSNNGTTTITITINGATDPPCFVVGTLIDTPHGPRPVESLIAGDLVLTRDGGAQAIRWVGRTEVALHNPETAQKFQPIRIAAGAFGPGVPDRDILVSPMHRILIEHRDAELLFGEPEVLCSANALINDFSIRREAVDRVGYIHLLFDTHQVVTSSGCASESFYPGTVGMDGLDIAQREELFTLFPDLSTLPQSYGRTARAVLRGFEARVMRDRLLPEPDAESIWAKRNSSIR
ncbi:Hint domain-containing protein [uncultured Shimia sp.]|uniref:Hint domain-containing protein n=1 Tax=uncultured Shimia sp. TaxID=573152 RepID=UPI0026346C1D|nr:Hint domain-containing protein [uncultured Shimia sp.]